MDPSNDGSRDRRLLYAAAFVRSVATGTAGVLIGIYLARLGFDPVSIGIVIGLGLAGAAVAALIVTLEADRLGRRKSLIAMSLIGAAGGIAIAAASGVTVIAAAAFLGMLNGMGRDRGASLILDQAILPGTTTAVERTTVFARYNVIQDLGHAIGGLLAGVPTLLRSGLGFEEVAALRVTFVAYAGLLLVTALVYARLSDAAEGHPSSATAVRVSAESRRLIWKISSLFAVDSLAGGFLTTALLAFFFYERFGVGEAMVGLLFFAARLANAGSHLAAAWLARRIGLVNTMVFTHIPSSLLLVFVPFAPSFPVAAALFLLREGLVEMDVPTRQSYVMAVVQPGERTYASGMTNLVRLASWAVAPSLAGLLMSGFTLGTPLFVGAGMKVGYDLLLYSAFRRHAPPEERVPS